MAYRFSASTSLSAPGKVLLTGGYLVLDRNYSGTVFALDARIHAIVQQLRRFHRKKEPTTSGSGSANGAAGGEQAHGHAAENKENDDAIIVRSPQFTNAVWEYGIERVQNGGGVRVIQKGDG